LWAQSYDDPMITIDARRECPRCRAVLPDALAWCSTCRTLSSPTGSLAGVDLRGRTLDDVDLRGADLRGAVLAGARLCRANLVGADLRGATLINADLTAADLSDANLDGVDMGGAQLSGAIVRGASLHRSKIDMVYAAVLAGYRGTPAWLPSGQSMLGATGERFVTALGAPLRCPLCGGESFSARDVTLGSRGLALFDLEWLGTSACALSCTVCTHMMWFARAPARA